MRALKADRLTDEDLKQFRTNRQIYQAVLKEDNIIFGIFS
jgi:hypothetical protein